MSFASLSIVILNYKNYIDTINCIDSILSYDTKIVYRIIVVDNASNNQSLQKIHSHFADSISTYFWSIDIPKDTRLILVENEVNSGYAAGNNIGLRIGYELGSEYLLVLNNDILFISNAVDSLVSELQKKEDALCVGPILLKKDGSYDYNCAKRKPRFSDFYILSYFGRWLKTKRWHKEYYYLKGNVADGTTVQVDVISGSCMLFRANIFKEIGFFDDRTFLYFEEAILCEKGEQRALKMYLVSSESIIHLGAQSTSVNSVSSDFTIRCEYNSALHYLTHWRGLSTFQARLLCFPMYVFMTIYKYKNNLKK